MVKDYVIGVDIGTGSLKALAVDTSGMVCSSAQVSYPTFQREEIYSEQDPEQIWAAFVQSIKTITNELKQSPVGIGLSTAMHSLILMQEGKPITPMITWADNRASRIAEKLRASDDGKRIYEESGTPIHAMSPLCKIAWFSQHQPKVLQQADKVISIKEFIWFKLFGVYEVDFSIASATGLMNILTCSWNDASLQFAGVMSTKLSAIIEPHSRRTGACNAIVEEANLSATTPFIIGGSDGCMANLGSFATEQGIAALTIGTSGAIRVASEAPVYNYSAMTFNYRLSAKTFICGGPTNNGGVVLKWYAECFLNKKLTTSADYNDLFKQVAKTDAGAEGLIFLPYILGERAPIWDSDASGVFYGLKNYHKQEHLTRAVIEGVSMALYSIAENMEQTGLVIDEIHASGGFVHSTEWLQILADMFGKKIRLVNTSDASALGAAYLTLHSLGLIKQYEELKSKTTKEILPREQVFKQYQGQYELYKKLYTTMIEKFL